MTKTGREFPTCTSGGVVRTDIEARLYKRLCNSLRNRGQYVEAANCEVEGGKTSGRVANRNRVASVIARRIALVTPHAPHRAVAGEEKAASSDNGQKEGLVLVGSSESKPRRGARNGESQARDCEGGRITLLVFG
jgi:hypothetical protein